MAVFCPSCKSTNVYIKQLLTEGPSGKKKVVVKCENCAYYGKADDDAQILTED